ncbi:MAG: type II toxin-antitoxin system VapC family toxin [Pirellulales bacterium]
MATVYVESSIISYLRRRPSSDIVNAARQVLTHRWWSNDRAVYDLVISQYVLDEIAAGDPALAADRLQVVEGVAVLPPAAEIPRIAAAIMEQAILPPKAEVDALHIATVAHHRIDFLLTWNCSHIANARILPGIYRLLEELHLPRPVICTPEELLGDDSSAEN